MKEAHPKIIQELTKPKHGGKIRPLKENPLQSSESSMQIYLSFMFENLNLAIFFKLFLDFR